MCSLGRMVSEFTDGDPGRSIALLWGVAESGRRGPKPRHTVEGRRPGRPSRSPDAEGLAALFHAPCGRNAAGLAHVALHLLWPSKAELTDLMVDRVAGEMVDFRPGRRRTGVSNSPACAASAGRPPSATPWIMQLARRRPPLGPNVLGPRRVHAARHRRPGPLPKRRWTSSSPWSATMCAAPSARRWTPARSNSRRA